jgi:prepilin-type N-terminal cleavage/methylation domain-containing protein
LVLEGSCGAHDHHCSPVSAGPLSAGKLARSADRNLIGALMGRPKKTREEGFTLIELLVTMVLLAIMFTLGSFALKTYWLRRALTGSTDEVTAQLRQLQQRAVAESHPLIYGARFTENADTYTLLKYNPLDSTPPLCEQMTTLSLEDGVEVASGTSFTSSPYITPSECGPVDSSDHFVFFFARGTATGGTLRLSNKQLEGTSQDTTTISVTNLTGRVEEKP